MSTQSNKRWASADTAAKHMGSSRKTVDRMCADGKLTRYKIGGRVLIDLDELDALITESQPTRTRSNLAGKVADQGVRFVDELPPNGRGSVGGRGSASYDKIRLELLSNRGRWAEVASFPANEGNRATAVANALRRDLRGERYEAVTRRIGDMVHVYARAVEA